MIDNYILEALIQDGKTIDLIKTYISYCCCLHIEKNKLKEIINNLYNAGLIKIAYPLEYVNQQYLDDIFFDEYWFELSTLGEKECIRRGLMCGNH